MYLHSIEMISIAKLVGSKPMKLYKTVLISVDVLWLTRLLQLVRRCDTEMYTISKRNAELQRQTDGISPKMQTLKTLMRYGMIERRVYPEVPPVSNTP